MSKSRKRIRDLLRDAAGGQYPIRIERISEWFSEDVCGFVVGVSQHWVVMQSLADTVYFDGYEILRIQDITDVVDDREGGYIERAIASLGRPDVDFRVPKEARTVDVLHAAAEHSALICVQSEIVDAQAMLIGKITRLGDRKFDIQLIDPRGVWLAEPIRESYKDVTRITFGDRYSTALARFGDALHKA